MLDDIPSHQMVDQLRLNLHLARPFWDFSMLLNFKGENAAAHRDGEVTRVSPVHLAAFMYEYSRQMDESLLAGADEETWQKLKSGFPGEWPSVPFLETTPEHCRSFLLEGWRVPEESALFVFAPEIPLKEARLLFDQCWKREQSSGKDQRGAGSPWRKLLPALKWLSHARLWSLIGGLTASWKVNDDDRFRYYDEFLEDEGLPRYSSLAKLKVAVRNCNLVTGDLLCENMF